VTKATVLWVVGLLALAVRMLYLSMSGLRQIPRVVLIAVGALVATLAITTVTSISPINSVVGQPSRFTGMATYIAVVAIFLAACVSFDLRAARVFRWVCTLVALPESSPNSRDCLTRLRQVGGRTAEAN
jgi:hypothetical protein